MPKKKRDGHYCKICGEYKANEKFSGKGHAAHICKKCSQLSAAAKAEVMTLNQLENFPVGILNRKDELWLENCIHSDNSEIAGLAESIYDRCKLFTEEADEKAQLMINTLVFEVHADIPDEYGDGYPVNKQFLVSRKARTISVTDFDESSEKTFKIKKMSSLLNRIVNELNIFEWDDDFGFFPYQADEAETEPYWRVRIECINGMVRDIYSDSDEYCGLGDPYALYDLLTEKFEKAEKKAFQENDLMVG